MAKQPTISNWQPANFPQTGFTGLGANPQGNVSALLQQLLKIAPIIGQAFGATGMTGAAGPVSTGAKKGQQAGAMAGLGSQGMAQQPMLDPVTDAVQKQVIKNTKAQVDEAMQSGVPGEHILQEQQKKAPILNRILGGAGNMMGNLLNQGGVNPQTGDYQQPSALFGMIKPTPSNQAILQQTYGIRPEVKMQQETALLSAALRGSKNKSQLQQEQKGGNAVKDILTTINSYDQIAEGIKGPIQGRFAGAIEGLSGGNEKVAEFDTQANSLLYSLAGYVTDQGGRSISDTELKQLEKSYKFSRNMSEKQFLGKLQGIINVMNNRLPADGQKLPAARELMKQVRGERDRQGGNSGGQSNGFSGKTSSGVSFTVE